MATLVLPERLAAMYEVREASLEDADDLYEMLVHRALDVVGYVNVTRADATSWMTPFFPQEPQWSFAIRDRATGTLATITVAEREFASDRMTATVRSDTRLPPADSAALAAAIWPQLIDWCRAVHPPDSDGRVVLHAGALALDTGLIASLMAVGFVQDRTFWSMAGAVTDQPDPPLPEPGVRIVDAADHRVVHSILEAAFAGSWGFQETPYDEWLTGQKAMPAHDPHLWRLAIVDGAPAATMIMAREPDLDELYVQELATLEEFRRRGVASALLAHAFDRARADGLAKVCLHVDSANPDNAPAVYRRAGLEVRLAANQYLLQVPV
jgi:ribosomal protein S18 acetylase RimI-like enzyme